MDLKTLWNWIVALVIGLFGPLLTLGSLQKVDGYPLYTMHYYGSAAGNSAVLDALRRSAAGAGAAGTGADTAADTAAQPASEAWGCSLFAAFQSQDGALFGRNFDWEYSPALLLFNHPLNGYDSVSMVDIAYLGLSSAEISSLDTLPLLDRGALLAAPYLPFDGMNEYGLVVGMAAVPFSQTPSDPGKESIGSLGVIREMLDHAQTVDEALAVMDRYTIDWTGGPPVHYLIADASGRAVLVEFYLGQRVVIPMEGTWEAATNFLRAQYASPKGHCWRYDRLAARLTETNGAITPDQALTLLSEVSQPNTQWSIVYGIKSGSVQVVMHRKYDTVYPFQIAPGERVPQN